MMIAIVSIFTLLDLQTARAADYHLSPTATQASDQASSALEQLNTANKIRHTHARALAEWSIDRQRLQALLEATNSEITRLEKEESEAAATRDTTRTQLESLGNDSELESIRTQLDAAGKDILQNLNEIARRVPPGTISAITNSRGITTFELATRALEAAEDAASSVTVEVITGNYNNTAQAVKMLRVSGAAAWWVSLDESQAGTVAVSNGNVYLTLSNEHERAAIRQAILQIDGRAQPSLTLLPMPTSSESKQ